MNFPHLVRCFSKIQRPSIDPRSFPSWGAEVPLLSLPFGKGWGAGDLILVEYLESFSMIYLGKFHHDLTSRPNPGIMVNKGNHPQMALIQVCELL